MRHDGRSTAGSNRSRQGRSSSTRFIGAGTASRRTVPNPASAASARSAASPACAPSGSEDVAVRWDTAFGVQARVGDGVEHPAERVEVVLHVVGAERLDQQHRPVGRQRLPGP